MIRDLIFTCCLVSAQQPITSLQPAVIVHLDPAVCFADQAIFGNENYEIPFHDTFFLEFVPYLMRNICLLALSFRSQKSDADSVAAARSSFPAGRPFRGHPFQENNHKNLLRVAAYRRAWRR